MLKEVKCNLPKGDVWDCTSCDGCQFTEIREPQPDHPSALIGLLDPAAELARFVDVVEQAVNNPDSKAAQTVMKLAVTFYRDKGI